MIQGLFQPPKRPGVSCRGRGGGRGLGEGHPGWAAGGGTLLGSGWMRCEGGRRVEVVGGRGGMAGKG